MKYGVFDLLLASFIYILVENDKNSTSIKSNIYFHLSINLIVLREENEVGSFGFFNLSCSKT